MALAIILGVLAGVVGCLPLVIGLQITKRLPSAGNFGHMSVLMLCLVVSFALMFAFAIICINVARDVAIPFVVAEALTLSVAAIVFGILRARR